MRKKFIQKIGVNFFRLISIHVVLNVMNSYSL